MLGKNRLIAAAARHTCTVFHNASKLNFFVDFGSEITAIPLMLIKTNTWFVENVYGPTSLSNMSRLQLVTLHVSIRDNNFPWTFLMCKSLRQNILGADFMSPISLS